jgi:hypothetical protein
MEGFREGMILWDKSQEAWHLIAPATSYVTGHTLANLLASIAATKAQDVVPSGTDRFFMTRVSAVTNVSATVTTCDDGSKFRERNPRTGRIDPFYTAKPDQAYLFETWSMVRLSGHWAITGLSTATLPDHRAYPCQPSP